VPFPLLLLAAAAASNLSFALDALYVFVTAQTSKQEESKEDAKEREKEEKPSSELTTSNYSVYGQFETAAAVTGGPPAAECSPFPPAAALVDLAFASSRFTLPRALTLCRCLFAFISRR
jgi:hypothetical protein